jgi:hypothetical protein
MYKQARLGKKAGEEKLVPLLVRAFGDKQVEAVSGVAELAAFRPEPSAELPCFLVEVGWRTVCGEE